MKCVLTLTLTGNETLRLPEKVQQYVCVTSLALFDIFMLFRLNRLKQFKKYQNRHPVSRLRHICLINALSHIYELVSQVMKSGITALQHPPYNSNKASFSQNL